MPTGAEIRADEQFVESQGEMVTLLNKDRARATWYRPDGLAIPNLPVDFYHRTLYKGKGWTLVPPGETAPSLSQNVVAEVEKEMGVSAPPRHIHVMQAELGSPCLVQGCQAVRQRPKGTFKITSPKKGKGDKK